MLAARMVIDDQRKSADSIGSWNTSTLGRLVSFLQGQGRLQIAGGCRLVTWAPFTNGLASQVQQCANFDHYPIGIPYRCNMPCCRVLRLCCSTYVPFRYCTSISNRRKERRLNAAMIRYPQTPPSALSPF